MQIDIVDFSIDIGRKNLKFDFNWDGASGAVIGTVEPLVIVVFKGMICNAIESAIGDAVNALSPIINQLLIA
jgi:hypothetical protein